jgi:hypothetical protein
MERTHLFITAVPRSGATLLELMLSSHPDISISPETDSLEYIICAHPKGLMLSGPPLNVLKERILGDAKLGAWKVDLEPYRRRLAAVDQATTAEIADGMMAYYRDQAHPGARIVGNGRGFYMEHGEVAKTVFPDAQFVIIIRDPRAVVASLIQNFGRSVEGASLTWRQGVELGEALARRFPSDCLQVKYEELVADPEAVLGCICAFLGVEYSSKMLAYHEANQRLEMIPVGQERLHPHTAAPLSTEHAAKWRDQLSPSTVGVIEAIAGRVMRRWDYDASGAPAPGLLARMKYALRYQLSAYRRWRKHRRYRHLVG